MLSFVFSRAMPTDYPAFVSTNQRKRYNRKSRVVSHRARVSQKGVHKGLLDVCLYYAGYYIEGRVQKNLSVSVAPYIHCAIKRGDAPLH